MRRKILIIAPSFQESEKISQKFIGESYREEVLPKWEVEYSLITGIMRIFDLYEERKESLIKLKELFQQNDFKIVIIYSPLKYNNNDGDCFYAELQAQKHLNSNTKVVLLYKEGSNEIIDSSPQQKNLFRFNLENEKSKNFSRLMKSLIKEKREVNTLI